MTKQDYGAAPSANEDLVRKVELDAKQAGPLTGDVTTSGAAATIANDAVTFAKMANVATDRLIGRDTASTGDPEALTVGGGIEFTGSGGIQTSAFTGDVTKSAGGTATTIANDAVTYAKMQNVSATARILGRNTAGSGDVEELTGATAGGIIEPAWASYTPTITQSATITKTVGYAKYSQVGKTVKCNVYVSLTSAGTANNAVSISLPVTAVALGHMVGIFYAFDTSATNKNIIGICYLASTTTVEFYLHGTTSVFGTTTAGGYTAASGDDLSFSIEYEAA